MKPLWIISAILLLSGCNAASQNTNETSENDEAKTSTNNSLLNQTTTKNYATVVENTSQPIQAKLLAAQCAQCHGTFGVSSSNIESLVGEANEIPQEMAQYRNQPNHIMYPHALAYSDTELNLIAQYFSGLSGPAIQTSGDQDHD